MNEQERQEIEAIRAELEKLHRQHSLWQQTVEHLFTRLRVLEARAQGSAATERKLDARSISLDLMGQEMRLASAPPETTRPPADVPVAPPIIATPLKGAELEAPPATTPPAPGPPPLPPPPRIGRHDRPPEPPEPKESWEIRLGTYWLPRIGIVMMITALVFAAYYYHERLPLWAKVLAMYGLCGVGIGLGAWLEKKYEILGRSLFAGGLAGTYFVTYALHYVEPLRMIDNPVVCGVLLLCIVAVIVGLAQWRNRPLLAGMAILLGFYTSAISDVSSFTLVSNCLLAAGALYLMLVSGWPLLTGVGLLGTYGTYLIWLMRSGEQTTVHFKLGFVLLYWGLFTLAVFIARPGLVTATVRNVFASVNNLLGFFFLTHALLTHHLSARHWKLSAFFGAALVGLAWIGKRQFKEDNSTFSTYLITGLGLLTLAVVEKYSGYKTIAALAIESVLLLLLGHLLRQPIFRWFGAGAQALCVTYIGGNYLDHRGTADSSREIATWFCVVAAYFVSLIQHWHTRSEKGALRDDVNERFLATALAFLANGSLVIANWDFVPERWRATAAAAECAIIAGSAGLIRAGRLVFSSQLLLITAYGSFVGGLMNHWHIPAPLHVPVALVVVSLGCAWFTERKLSPTNPYAPQIRGILPIYLGAAVAVVIISLGQRLDEDWHLWTMTLTALAALGIGQFWQKLAWRWISFSAAAVAVTVFLGHEMDHAIDWNQRLVIASHFLALVLLILFERLAKASWPAAEAGDDMRRPILVGLVIAIAYLLLHILWRAASREYLTAMWTLGAFALFGLGLILKERAYRLAGLAVIGVSVGRAVLYDFWQIAEPLYRILSFVALGVILLLLGFLYAKFREKIARWL